MFDFLATVAGTLGPTGTDGLLVLGAVLAVASLGAAVFGIDWAIEYAKNKIRRSSGMGGRRR